MVYNFIVVKIVNKYYNYKDSSYMMDFYFYKKNKLTTRTDDEKRIDMLMLKFAREMPKLVRLLLHYNQEVNGIIFFSLLLFKFNVHLILNMIGLFLFIIFYIFKIFSAYYRTCFEKKLYDYI